MPESVIKIIGIGNPLMGDDGIGIAAIERLKEEALPPHVELIDGGCGGLTLLQLLEDCRRAIIIDAADFQGIPGTIRLLNASDLINVPDDHTVQLSHQSGLQDVLLLAQRLSRLPPITLVVMQIESCRPGLGLSLPVQAALPNLMGSIRNEIISS